MKWDWRLGRLAGIDVYVNVTFFLLPALIGLKVWSRTGELVPVVLAILGILVLFGVVVLHELGHALAARRYGIGTRDIILLPIGGMARLERMPDKPYQEFVVALAGPAVNVALAALAGVPLLFSGEFGWDAEETGVTLLRHFFIINVALAVFNMLPAFPMDGGRVLRSVLAARMGMVRATAIAANVGKVMAVLFGVLGLLTNPFLILIALFVWFGASAETSMVRMRAALSGARVRDLMVRYFAALHPADDMQRAMDLLLHGMQHDFPVVDPHGRLLGMVNRGDLLDEAHRLPPETPVRDISRDDYPVFHPLDGLESAFARLQESNAETAPVVHEGVLVGLLLLENLAEYIHLQDAREASAVRG